MFNFRIILLSLLVAASVIASLMIHHRGDAVFQAQAETSHRQSQQLNDLRAERDRLSNSLAHITASAPSSHSAEIAKLHAEAEALRKQTNELGASRNSHRATSDPSQSQPSHTPEYWAKMREIEGIRGAAASNIAMALLDYASDHQNQFPADPDQVASYLAKQHHSLNGTNFTMPALNNFEIIFQGSTDQLNGISWGSIAVVREKQTWLSPDGTPTRVYGMVNGLGQTVSSDDNFQSWEAEHVIPAPKSP